MNNINKCYCFKSQSSRVIRYATINNYYNTYQHLILLFLLVFLSSRGDFYHFYNDKTASSSALSNFFYYGINLTPQALHDLSFWNHKKPGSHKAKALAFKITIRCQEFQKPVLKLKSWAMSFLPLCIPAVIALPWGWWGWNAEAWGVKDSDRRNIQEWWNALNSIL